MAKKSERQILELLRAETDLSSNHQIGEIGYADPEIRYHLSPERSALVRHFDFSGKKVLELNAGMGAVSRSIAERAMSLTAVESSDEKLEALSQRMKGLKNWKGISASLEEFKANEKFDLVCTFDLPFESPHSSPAALLESFINKASEHLQDDGVLLLTVENRLGLKYWSGTPFFGSNRLFDGICSDGHQIGSNGLARQEVLYLLRSAGYSAVKEYFPFPDSRFPKAVLTPEFIQECPEIASEISTGDAFENPHQRRLHFFSDILAMQGLAKAQLLTEFSNSFIFVASKNQGSLNQITGPRSDERELGWLYSFGRRNQAVTSFLETSDRVRGVSKKPLNSSNPPVADGNENNPYHFKWVPSAFNPLIRGETLRYHLFRCLYLEDLEGFYSEFEAFLKWIFDHHASRNTVLDAIFVNAVREARGVYQLFDLEWECDSSQLKKSTLVFRNVFVFARHLLVLSVLAPEVKTLKELYFKLCADLGISSDFDSDLIFEASFQSAASRSTDFEQHRKALENLFNHRIPPYFGYLDPEKVHAGQHAAVELPRVTTELSKTTADLRALEHQVSQLRDELKALDDSHWVLFRRLLRNVNHRLERSPRLHGIVNVFWRLGKMILRR